MEEKERLILTDRVKLRTYLDVKWAMYFDFNERPFALSEEEYKWLLSCDGNNLVETTSDLALGFINMGAVKVYEEGDKLSKYQILNCDNNLFPKINIMLTGKCNYNCLHCFNAKDNARLNTEFSLEEGLKLIEEACLCGVRCWRITGGEPMIHKHFFEFLAAIYEHEMFVSELNTNGYFLTQESFDRFKEIGFHGQMKISYDGISGWHDWLRDFKGADEITIKALKLCVKNGYEVKVQTNVHKKNLHTMLDTIKLMDSIGCDEIRIIRTSESPRWLRNGENYSLGLDEYYEEMLKLVQEYNKLDLKIILDIWQVMTMYPKEGFYLTPINCRDGEFSMDQPVCRQNRMMIAIAADGNLFPCNQMSGYYELHNDLLGNCKKTPLKELLTKSRYLEEVNTTVEEVYNHDKDCHECEFFEYCAGGCRAIALALSDDKLYKDPLKCMFFKGGYFERYKKALEGYTDYSKIRYSKLLSELLKALKKEEKEKENA